MDTSLYSGPSVKSIIQKLQRGENLNANEVYQILVSFEKDPNPIDLTAFLIFLKMKGESGEEVAGFVQFFTEKMITVQTSKPTLDIVGTGGDCARTVNISTASAILSAACGIPIAKHGNRSVSSLCGSADIISAFGIPLEMTPQKASECIENVNIAFLYAPSYHPFFKLFQPIRSRLGIKTIFNSLGPLLNPAKASYRLIGVGDRQLLEPLANAIESNNDIVRALIFHGNGIDELSTLGSVEAVLVNRGNKVKFEVDPQELGFRKCSLEELQGGDAALNRKLLVESLQGSPNAIGDTLALNAAAALWIYGKVKTLEEGVKCARDVLKSGKGYEKLKEWVSYARTNS